MDSSTKDMTIEIKILTLNVWGIPRVSRDRVERIAAVANQLVSGEEQYDFVFLQEVWSKEDYDFIAEKVRKVLPHSHYFHSGVIGSGTCTFSRSVITEVHFHSWSLNGLPHKIHHGDWWGGKGVALCRTLHRGVPFILFNTHLHAEYNRCDDEYLHHRVVQAFETSQLLRFCRSSQDVVVFAGDFNCIQSDVAYRLVRYNGGMSDAFCECADKPIGCNGETNETPANSYTTVKTLEDNPSGCRIDHVFFRSSSAFQVQSRKCDQPWPHRVPNCNFSFSDHEAVRAVLAVFPSKTGPPTPDHSDIQAETDTLLESAAVCEQGLRRISACRRRYFYIALFLVLLQAAYLVGTSFPTGIGVKVTLAALSVALMFVLVYCLFMCTVWSSLEYNGVTAARLGIKCRLEQLSQTNARLEASKKRPVPNLI